MIFQALFAFFFFQEELKLSDHSLGKKKNTPISFQFSTLYFSYRSYTVASQRIFAMYIFTVNVQKN